MNVNFRETDHLKTQISNNDIRHKELEEQIDEKEETINKYVCAYFHTRGVHVQIKTVMFK